MSLGQTFTKLKRKRRFQESMDVLADLANGWLLIYEGSKYAVPGGMVMVISVGGMVYSLMKREQIDEERLQHLREEYVKLSPEERANVTAEAWYYEKQGSPLCKFASLDEREAAVEQVPG